MYIYCAQPENMILQTVLDPLLHIPMASSFLSLANGIFNLGKCNTPTAKRRFASHFGASAQVVSYIWSEINQQNPEKVRQVHLLWALLFLKVYSAEAVLAGMVKVNEKTFRTWVWIVLGKLSSLSLVGCNQLFFTCMSN